MRTHLLSRRAVRERVEAHSSGWRDHVAEGGRRDDARCAFAVSCCQERGEEEDCEVVVACEGKCRYRKGDEGVDESTYRGH